MRRLLGRKAGFWIAVGGAAVLAPFTLQLAACKLPLPGLRRFLNFTYGSNNEEC